MKIGLMGRIRQFLSGTMAELSRCTWPGKGELFESTLLVILVTVLVTVFVAGVDFVARGFISIITGTL